MKTPIIQDEPARQEPRPAREPTPTTYLTGRMGQWSARHRKTAIFGWLAFVVLAVVLGKAVGVTMIDENTSGVGESGRADRILDAGFERPAAETVLVQSGTLSQDDPAFRAAVQDVLTRVSAVAAVIAASGLVAIPSSIVPIDETVYELIDHGGSVEKVEAPPVPSA
jgi:hypothetical protein